MDSGSQLMQLAAIDRDLAKGEVAIADQKEAVTKLERLGVDAFTARRELIALLETQAAHQRRRAEILRRTT